jgi:hypothetical protein
VKRFGFRGKSFSAPEKRKCETRAKGDTFAAKVAEAVECLPVFVSSALIGHPPNN